ncbi:competence type IV pilus minor pilin ComGD [Virgibacillus sp. DJP39]|uniref:competence type IV pilus minor pilin ComGD n=1 Tax=Virgibacillus sp. DJP39 TaxID=3409790 RepID=UPI003BB6C36E
MQTKNGFTLLEMILVLGVVSALLLLSTPVMVSLLENQKDEQFLTTFENDVLYMQSISYLSKDYIGIKIYSDNYTILEGHTNTILKRRAIPPGWSFDLRTLKELISFNQNGTIRQSGTIYLTTTNNSYKIVFPPGKGRCYIEKI